MSDDLNDALAHDHEEIDKPITAYVAQSADADPAALKQAVAELRSHIFMEEEVLFPPLAQAGMAMPVMVMHREHAEMWPVLDAIDAEISDGADRSRLSALSKQLADLLNNHNPKEEAILYPQTDGVLDGEDAVQVHGLLDTHAFPEGWVPKALQK